MKTAILTDTNGGMSKAEAEAMGIFCLPMPVLIDGKDYYEDVNISVEEYTKALLSQKEVSTSMPSPMNVTDEWDRILALGYDEIVYIPMSSGLSGSCAMAQGLADDYGGRVLVVDNKRISIAQKTSVLDAKYLVEKGKSGSEIKEVLEKMASDYIVYLAVDTLKYFMRSGRASSRAASLVSDVLNVKPILKTNGEKFEPVTIARSIKKCEGKILEALRLNLETRFRDLSRDELVIAAATNCIHKKDADSWLQTVKDAFPDYPVFYVTLSCSITTHTGPDARGMGIMRILKRT